MVAYINVVQFRLRCTAYNVFVMLLFLQIIFMMYNFLLQDPRKILIAAKAAIKMFCGSCSRKL
jgi:hypothetical protein